MKTTSRRSFFGHMFVASAEDSNVGIIDFAFKPAALTVKTGTTGRSIPPLAFGMIFRSTAMDADDIRGEVSVSAPRHRPQMWQLRRRRTSKRDADDAQGFLSGSGCGDRRGLDLV
jgi:hypothetical protein